MLNAMKERARVRDKMTPAILYIGSRTQVSSTAARAASSSGGDAEVALIGAQKSHLGWKIRVRGAMLMLISRED
jgi:hypothetical protein